MHCIGIFDTGDLVPVSPLRSSGSAALPIGLGINGFVFPAILFRKKDGSIQAKGDEALLLSPAKYESKLNSVSWALLI